MNEDVIVLLLGATEGAYALAASFAEYGVACAVMDEELPSVFARSALFREVWRVPGIGYRGILLRALHDFYEKYAGKCLILLPTTEEYAARLLAEQEELALMYLMPQKALVSSEKAAVSPVGLLLSYVGSTGRARTLYGEIVACADPEYALGAPLALVTAKTPTSLPRRVPTGKPHFALYAVSKDGTLSPYAEDGALSPLVAFASAADTSLAEWILSDYVLCAEEEEGERGEDGEEENVPEGVFSLASYRKTLPYLLPHAHARVKRLRRARLYLSLYVHREEKKNPFFRLALSRYARENWQKRTKTKK